MFNEAAVSGLIARVIGVASDGTMMSGPAHESEIAGILNMWFLQRQIGVF
jgi:hypothetical protein